MISNWLPDRVSMTNIFANSSISGVLRYENVRPGEVTHDLQFVARVSLIGYLTDCQRGTKVGIE